MKTKALLDVSGLAEPWNPALCEAAREWAAVPSFCRGRGRQKPGDRDLNRRWFSPCWGLCIPGLG